MTPREEFRIGMLTSAARCADKSVTSARRFERLAYVGLAIAYAQVTWALLTGGWSWALAAAVMLPSILSCQRDARKYRRLYLGLREKILDDMNTTLREVDEMP